MNRPKCALTLTGVALILAIAPVPASATIAYTAIDLGVLPYPEGATSIAYGINDAGQVVGVSNDHPFIWSSDTGMARLQQLTDYSVGAAYGINNAGIAVGYEHYVHGGWSGQHAAITVDYPYGSNPGVDFDSLAHQTPDGYDSVASAINDNGWVVGWRDDQTGHHAILGSQQVPPFSIAPYGSSYSEAYDINDHDQVVGIADDHAFFWDPYAGAQDIGALPGDFRSFGRAVNDAGQVVGYSVGDDLIEHGFLWDSETGMIDLGLLPGRERLWASDLNEAGQVVGTSFLDPSNPDGGRAVLWTAASGLVNLNDLIDPLSGWTLVGANAINETGQIVGWGYQAGLPGIRAIILNPLGPPGPMPDAPEPGTWAMLVIGFAAVGSAMRRRRGAGVTFA